jgi:hypothetical protein
MLRLKAGLDTDNVLSSGRLLPSSFEAREVLG